MTTIVFPVHRTVRFAVLAILSAVMFTAVARAASPAEDFVQTNVQRGLAILNDKTLSVDQTQAQFRSFLESLTDIRRIALFTLGPAGKAAPPSDVDAFVSAFRDYTNAVYQSQLAQYSGQTLKVTGSTERAPGDFIVSTLIAAPNGEAAAGTSEVDFRVSDAGGKMTVVDASVGGIWLAIQERAQFGAFLSQHNDDVKALSADLEKRATSMRTGGPAGN
jgi:phospholipid transport system substrate-binding protein